MSTAVVPAITRDRQESEQKEHADRAHARESTTRGMPVTRRTAGMLRAEMQAMCEASPVVQRAVATIRIVKKQRAVTIPTMETRALCRLCLPAGAAMLPCP